MQDIHLKPNYFPIKCVNLEGKGFILDSYVCQCKFGYYRKTNLTISNQTIYSCIKCSDGCEKCEGF